MPSLTSEEIDQMILGNPGESAMDECPCDGLHRILKSQGLSLDDFMLAAEAAPEDLSDFVSSTNSRE